jgi:hypothetical protein
VMDRGRRVEAAVGSETNESPGISRRSRFPQRNRNVSPRPAHEKRPCTGAPPARNGPRNDASPTAVVNGALDDELSTSSVQLALRRNWPSTGSGVTRRGGHGPRQDPALGGRLTWNPGGTEGASSLSF